MRVLVFGTYDAQAHPRVGVLAEGLRDAGADVEECNAPLGVDTAARVALLGRPWRAPAVLARLLGRWVRLWRASRAVPPPDAVLVGYLGHLDVHLARRCFPRAPVVLDHLVFAADTARDRGAAGTLTQRALAALDVAALRAADVVVVDTEEHRREVPAALRSRAVVVPVGAPTAWYEAGARRRGPHPGTTDLPLRVVFYGLYTPLQGAPVIGRALARLAGLDGVTVTMVGHGQDLAATRAAAARAAQVTWYDWVPAAELPDLVAGHDVCLGIFGTGPKALRVVPNKVYQGLAAGCAVVTSATAPQRRLLGDAALLVPPGDDSALAAALERLAADRVELERLRRRGARAAAAFRPGTVVTPLLERLRADRGEA